MSIAFYAPLKSPNHPRPSGDRQLARSLIDALRRTGHEVMIASELRAFEGDGDLSRQRSIRKSAEAEAEALIHAYRQTRVPDAWFTYHVYHKAPDWIGPRVTNALGIPYLVAEASVSPRQAAGPWALGHRQAIACLSRANAMIVLNTRDMPCATAWLRRGARIVAMRPFVDLDVWLSGPRDVSGGEVRLASVAMMRNGDKSRSWSLLADWLASAMRTDITLDAVGDGSARRFVETRLRAVLGDRVRFHGQLSAPRLREVLDRCQLFVWPAINEAFGMAMVEAQARGLAVLAGREGGVAGVVAHGVAGLLVDPRDPDSAAQSMIHLIDRPAVVARMGQRARDNVSRQHGLDTAARHLGELLQDLCARSY